MIHQTAADCCLYQTTHTLSYCCNTVSYCCNTVYNCYWCLKTDNVTDNVTEADLIDEANETDEAQIIV